MFDNLVNGFKTTIRAPILRQLREIDLYRRWSQLPSNKAISIREYLQRNGDDESSYQHIHPAHIVKLRRPSNQGSLHPDFEQTQFESPATFVSRLHDCRFFGRGVATVTPDERLLSDVTIHIGGRIQDHAIMRLFKLPQVQPLDGTIAILSCPGGNTYYHWLFDVLPRIKLIQMSGIRIEEVDHFVVNSLRSKFQGDTIKLAGIESSQIVASDKAKYFLCEDMIQPSFTGTTLYPVKWVCDYLVETLLPKKRLGNIPAAPRLYIPRRNVPRRRILNQSELESFLIKHGFKVVDPAEYDVPSQAQLFNRAEVIVAPHGSGLTNLVFCQPGTTVIELFPPSVMPLCYWILSSQKELNYFYHIGTEPRGAKHSDFAVNLDELSSLFKEAGLKTL